MPGIGHNQLRSIVERIERLKDEQDALAADIREVYAEAKSNGYDKTALGQVVTIRRKRAKDPQAFEERSAMVDLYLAALDGTIDAIARPHAHEGITPDTRSGEGAQPDTAFGKPSRPTQGGNHEVGDAHAHDVDRQDAAGEGVKAVLVDPAAVREKAHNFDRPPPIPDFLRRDA